MILLTKLDNKKAQVTVGKDYDAIPWGPNGAIITADNGERLIILKERLQ